MSKTFLSGILALSLAAVLLIVKPAGAESMSIESSVSSTSLSSSASTENPEDLAHAALARYFSGKSYSGADRLYTWRDCTAPKELWGALTNTGISYLALLRNEIYARHGLVFSDLKYKKTLEKTGWFKPNTNFNLNSSPNEKEKKTSDFIKKLEAIDKGDSGAKWDLSRQLAVLLTLPKEELTWESAPGAGWLPILFLHWAR